MARISLYLILLALVALPGEQFNVVAGAANVSEAALILGLGSLFVFSRRRSVFKGPSTVLTGYIRWLVIAFLLFAIVEHSVLLISPVMDAYAPGFIQQAILRTTGIAAICWGAFVNLEPEDVDRVAAAVLVGALLAASTIILDASGVLQIEASRRADTRIGGLSPFGVSATGIMSTKGSIALLTISGVMGAIHLAQRKKLPRLFVVSLLAFLLFGALASGSRTLVAGFLMLILLFLAGRAFMRPGFGATAALAGWAATAATFFTGLGEALWSDLIIRGGQETRLQLVDAAWRTIQDHPIFGVGPYYQPFAARLGEQIFWNGSHTIWLQMPLYSGVMGWVLALVLLAGPVAALVHMRRTGTSKFFVSIGVILVLSTFYQPLQSGFVVWGLLFGVLVLLSRYDPNHAVPRRSAYSHIGPGGKT